MSMEVVFFNGADEAAREYVDFLYAHNKSAEHFSIAAIQGRALAFPCKEESDKFGSIVRAYSDVPVSDICEAIGNECARRVRIVSE